MQNYRINLLQRLVRERGLHKNKIAHLAGISPNSLSRLLKGTNQLNSVETIEGLARELNVHPGIFFGDFEMMDYVQREVIDLPLIVGFINIIKKEIMENSERIPTPKSMLRDIDIVSEETFWVQALGNAFAPRVRHGDQVLISRAALKSGDLAVIVYPKTNALFLKRYMNYGGRVSLIPENPEDHENIEIASNDIEEQSIVLYKVLRIASIP